MYQNLCKSKLKKICMNFSTINSIKIWLNKNKGGSIYLKSLNNNVKNIVIDNPQFHNCITGEMICQLDDCVDTLERDPPKALILSSVSGNFCSGASIQLVKEASEVKSGEQFSKFMQNVVKRIETLPSLSVALIEGIAFGGGAELVLCCDFRFIAENGKISFKQRQMGIVPAWGGCHRLIRLIGKQETLKLLVTADIISAKNALEKGLVDTVLVSNNPEERLGEALKILNNMIEETPKSVLFAIKKVVTEISTLNTDVASDIETKILKSVWGKEDHLSALLQFRKNK